MSSVSRDKEFDTVQNLAKWLTREQKRLGFSKEELAEGIGKNRDTVERYMNGDNKKPPSEEVYRKIFRYITSLEECGEYKRQTPEKFGELLSQMLKALGLTQQQFADMIGKSQRDVSNYTYGKINSYASEQYDILACLYKEVTFDYGTPETVSDVARELEYLLFGEECEYDPYSEPFYYDYDEAVCYSSLIEFFETLSYDVQVQILRHYRAFFEQTDEQLENGVTMMLSSFHDRVSLMNDLRGMSEAERSDMVYKFEQNALMTYPHPDNAEEITYFAAVADMRSLVTDREYFSVLESAKNNPKPPKGDKNRYLFEQLICRHGIMPDVIDELKLKLSFTGYEWYVWSLILIFFHNNDGDFEL